jgi:hypothetical protein
MIDRAENRRCARIRLYKDVFLWDVIVVGARSLTMPSESSPMLQAQASVPGNSQVLSQTAGRSSPNSPDPESHPKSIAEDGKAGSLQNVLTVIPLLLVGKLSE